MDNPDEGFEPKDLDPFKRSSRMSRSPTRGSVSTQVKGVGITGPAALTVERPVSSHNIAVEEYIRTPTSDNATATGNALPMDVISVPTLKGGKSPTVSPIRSADLVMALQNDDLRSILAMIRSKTNVLLTAFETKRHASRETKGAVTELSALINRAIELHEGNAKEVQSTTIATQTEAQKSAKKATLSAQVPKVQVPKECAPKVGNNAGGSKPVEKGKTNPKESKPVSYASVAKDASSGGEWVNAKPKRLRKKPEALILKKTGEASYAEMLRKLKADPSLSELGKHVRKIRRTQQGELLLEVEGKAAECVPKFKRELEATLKEMAAVRTGAHKIALSCSGIDEARTAAELHSCLVNQFQGIQLNPEDVKSLRRTWNGTQIATILLKANDAIAVLKLGTVTVGWSRCRIIEDVRPTRCYRCLGYGH